MGRHDSLLFPSRRQEKQNYSALAQFSSLTLQEHEATMQQLVRQKEMVVQAMASLSEQESECTRRHRIVMEELIAEERDTLALLAGTNGMIENLDVKLSEEKSQGVEKRQRMELERRSLDEEMEEMIALESQMQGLERKYTGTLEEVNERKKAATLECEAGLSLLDRTRQAARMAATNLSRYGAGAASTTVVSNHPMSVQRIRATSPPRRGHPDYSAYVGSALQETTTTAKYVPSVAVPPSAPITPRVPSVGAGGALGGYQPRSITPTRAPPAATRSPPGATLASPVRSHRTSITSGSLTHVGASPSKSAYNHHTSPSSKLLGSHSSEVPIPGGSFVGEVRHSPQRNPGTRSPVVSDRGSRLNESHSSLGGGSSSAASGGRTKLHVACSSSHRDVDAIHQMLREFPDLVGALDGNGNTALHCACSATDPALEVVHSLLLAGSSTTVKNEDGLTAFHMACMNTGDSQDHKLKRFLIYKVAQNPNLRTSSGETAAHLCAAHDRHHATLKYLCAHGLDVNLTAVLPAPEPNQPARRSAPLDVARAAGAVAARNTEFLAAKRNA